MGPPPRAKAALDAMKVFGFDSKRAKNELKNLLQVYSNNYELIEENGYQLLIEKILEEQESKDGGGQEQDTATSMETESRRKRLRKLSDSPGEASLKKPKVEADDSPKLDPGVKRSDLGSSQGNDEGKMVESITPLAVVGGNTTGDHAENITTTGVISPLVNRRETRSSTHTHNMITVQEDPKSSSLLPNGEESGKMICYKEPKIEPGIEVMPPSLKDREADDDSLDAPNPIAMICPPENLKSAEKEAHAIQQRENGSSRRSLSIVEPKTYESAAKIADKGKAKVNVSNRGLETGKQGVLVTSQEGSTSDIDIASSDTGEVNLKLCFNSDCPDLHMPSLDAIIKRVEERCLRSYKLLEPEFSLTKILKDMCQCATELSTEATVGRQENVVQLTTSMKSLKSAGMQSMFREGNACPMDGSANGDVKIDEKSGKNNARRVSGESASQSLAVIPQPQIALGDLRPPHDPNDITKGEERVRISLVNEISNEKFPSSFNYIAQNIAYQGAYLNFTLARIGDDDCCSDCFGDCVAATIPCPCARETGGEFAYTLDDLVKEVFLDDCISMKREPQKHHHCYCKECPIERSKKGGMSDSCKGHLARRFIKECWNKCGCNKQCGNRIVQRGITCNLQVFYTREGKGWGLRTLDELPKGYFVCEYVGEVLTNTEVYNRTIQSADSVSYPVLLDGGWASESDIKDEDALCLDATFYGNVARFVNHRCSDANLVDIPIEVESPDHHYYHIALFTTRKIEAYEELTWDYGINFDDQGPPIKAFKCRCGSKFCRDKRRSRTRSKALVLS